MLINVAVGDKDSVAIVSLGQRAKARRALRRERLRSKPAKRASARRAIKLRLHRRGTVNLRERLSKRIRQGALLFFESSCLRPRAVLPSSSVAGMDLKLYEAGYYRRI